MQTDIVPAELVSGTRLAQPISVGLIKVNKRFKLPLAIRGSYDAPQTAA
jgi:hypothetical protein